MKYKDYEFIKKNNVPVEEINGVEYMNINDFAKLIGKDKNYVYTLAKTGNQCGTLRMETILRKKLIPVSELFDFDFIDRQGGYMIYNYTFDGQKEYKEGV